MMRILATALVFFALAAPAAEPKDRDDEQKPETTGTEARVLSRTRTPASAATPVAPADVKKDSPFVAAAKAAQKAREKRGEAKLAIDDQDLTKEGGRLTISSGAGPDAPPERNDMEILRESAAQREQERETKASEERNRRTEIEAEIARLERELGSLEEVAHDVDELELSPRLAEVASRFEEKKKRLSDLRRELARLGGSGRQP